MPYRVGGALRCKDEWGEWDVGVVDAVAADAVLVLLEGGRRQWIRLAEGRLQPRLAERRDSVDDDDDEDDDYACEVCGSALDSDHLLLCDTEGCDMAYHTSCLRAPLAAVPEGEWFCERCEERRAAGGELAESHALLASNRKRWRCRVEAMRSCGAMALVLISLERALRAAETAAATHRIRKCHSAAQAGRGIGRLGTLRLLETRTGEDGFKEFCVREQPAPIHVAVTVPMGAGPGTPLRIAAANLGAFTYVLPPYCQPGQKLTVLYDPSVGDEAVGGARVKPPEWRHFETLGVNDSLIQLLEWQLEVDAQRRKASADQAEIASVLEGLVATIEKAQAHQERKERSFSSEQHQSQQRQKQRLQQEAAQQFKQREQLLRRRQNEQINEQMRQQQQRHLQAAQLQQTQVQQQLLQLRQQQQLQLQHQQHQLAACAQQDQAQAQQLQNYQAYQAQLARCQELQGLLQAQMQAQQMGVPPQHNPVELQQMLAQAQQQLTQARERLVNWQGAPRRPDRSSQLAQQIEEHRNSLLLLLKDNLVLFFFRTHVPQLFLQILLQISILNPN